MSYQFPPDVEKLVQLKRDVQIGVEQANEGRATTLDVDDLIERCTRRLAAVGITD